MQHFVESVAARGMKSLARKRARACVNDTPVVNAKLTVTSRIIRGTNAPAQNVTKRNQPLTIIVHLVALVFRCFESARANMEAGVTLLLGEH
ncbi:MAG: hypothetical protein WEE89_15415 [Gemmatimonadota bacterium]